MNNDFRKGFEIKNRYPESFRGCSGFGIQNKRILNND